MAVNAQTSNYSVNKLHQAAWLVYINGIEVPAHSVSVNFGVWTIPTASIRLVPHVLLQRLGYEDRLQVEVYYLDEFFTPDTPKMCFMGEYEVVGWSYQSTAVGRFVQLDCKSPMKILEQLRFYFMSSLTDIASAAGGPTGTSGETFIGTSVQFPLSLFREGLVPLPGEPAGTLVRTPFEFMRNLFKALLGEVNLQSENPVEAGPNGELPKAMTGVAGKNFFGRWMKMTDFYRRWAALPYFDDEEAKTVDGCFPLLKAVHNKEILDALGQQIGKSVGEQGSAWELLQRIYGTMYMEMLAVPAPPAAQLQSKTNLPVGRFQRRGTEKENTYGGLINYMVKPQCIFGIPPACNVIFPSMVKSYNINENYEQQPTRIYLGESYISSMVTSQASGDMTQMAQDLLVTGYPGIVEQRMREYSANPKTNTRNFLIYPEELYRGPLSKHTNAPPWLYMLEKVGQSHTAATAVDVGGKRYARGRGKITTLERARNAYGEHVEGAAKVFGFPPEFLWGVISGESRFNASVISSAGAGGLMQMLSGTFLTHYETAMKMSKAVPPIPKYKPVRYITLTRKDEKGNFRKRPVYGPEVYALMAQEDKSIYAGAAMLWKLGQRYEVTDWSVSQLDPDREYPSRLQVALLAYNAGDVPGKQLLKVVKAYEAKKDAGENPKPTDYADSATWYWGKAGSRGRIAHWRWYCGNAFRGYNAAIASYKINKTSSGAAPSAPSSPVAPDPPASAGNYMDAPNPHTAQTVHKSSAGEAAAAKTPAASSGDSGTPQVRTGGGTEQGDVTGGTSIFNAPESAKALGELFSLYAKYEYYRSRFEMRSATVSLAFNPYIVPGFSAVVLDNTYSGFHMVGYVQSVSHSFSASGEMQTQVALSFVRTLPEYLKLMVTGTNDVELNNNSFNTDIDVGPTEAVQEVSAAFQLYDSAGNFFSQVLYPGILKQTPFVFDLSEMLSLTTVDGKDVNPDADNSSWNPEQGLIATPRAAFSDYFKSYDAAMTFASRPVATLEQMIELRHGKTVKDALKDSLVEQPLDTFSGQSNSARFYGRIYRFLQPGDSVSTEAIAKITNVGTDGSSEGGGNWEIITPKHQIPESRLDWDSILIKYRTVVRGTSGAAQQ